MAPSTLATYAGLSMLLLLPLAFATGVHGAVYPGQGGSATGGYGQATFYDGTNRGACGYGSDIPQYLAALSESLYRGSAGCGFCYRLECIDSLYYRDVCTGRSIVIRATDLCPSNGNPICAQGPHFDLNRAAFQALAKSTSAGVLRLKYTKVACPKASGMKVKVLGSNNWWLAVSFPNANEPIRSAKLKSSNGVWKSMQDSWGATFSYGGSKLGGSISFQLTGESGKTVTLKNCLSSSQWHSKNTYTCSGNF